MKKILVVFGTRPEVIKLYPIIEVLKNSSHKSFVCSTDQHIEMINGLLDFFKIIPDKRLNIMKSNQTLEGITISLISKLSEYIKEIEPDLIIVQGDTTTAFVASLLGLYNKIAVGHVEAGLRTNDLYSPWPEEFNRQVTSLIANLHFAPTQYAKDNLIKENKLTKSIYVTGNTVIDSLLLTKKKFTEDNELEAKIKVSIEKKGYKFSGRKIILITGHRRENIGNNFRNIFEAILEIAQTHNEIDIIYPVHLNPNVRDHAYSVLNVMGNVYLIEPLEYVDFVYLMTKSYLILTDSGGVQEEAPSLGIPVLVFRDKTERVEAVESGTVKLVGTTKNKIINETNKLLSDKEYYNKFTEKSNPYGKGEAAKIIYDIINEFFNRK